MAKMRHQKQSGSDTGSGSASWEKVCLYSRSQASSIFELRSVVPLHVQYASVFPYVAGAV